MAKRLLTEQKKSQPRVMEKISKKYRLSKYRRKAENKKERERMKKFNQAFTNLKNMLPNKGLGEEDIPRTEKETKVSCLPKLARTRQGRATQSCSSQIFRTSS